LKKFRDYFKLGSSAIDIGPIFENLPTLPKLTGHGFTNTKI